MATVKNSFAVEAVSPAVKKFVFMSHRIIRERFTVVSFLLSGAICTFHLLSYWAVLTNISHNKLIR